MRSAKAMNALPVILLLGAKSIHRPLASVPAEVSALKALLAQYKQAGSAFTLESDPYFTQEQLKATLDRLAGRVAILHFAGHSDGAALVTDESVVYARHIADILQSWPVRPALIFLNGCHNAEQVKLFHAAGVPLVIATHRAIDDGQAAGFAQAFYASLFAGNGQVTMQEAFTRAGSKVLMTENREVRSLDIDTLPQADKAGWDWGLFAQQPKQASWTLRELLTERPLYDGQGVLINPYRGLESFREEDQTFFFGREALIQELLAQIGSTALFTLLGASGSGKSSLIHAGLVPRLRANANQWLLVNARPGNAPFREIAKALVEFLYEDALEQLENQNKLATKLTDGDITLADVVRLTLKKSGAKRLLLFIDQFEELFTQSPPQTVQAFQQQLSALVQAGLPCTLLLVMRADFLGAALNYPELASFLNGYPKLFLSPMGKAELTAVITGPASKQQVQIEPNLTAVLLDDVENQPGSLPLLQHVLKQLWKKRDGGQITLTAYNQAGGLKRALENHANKIYQAFATVEQQTQCQQIFLHLVQLADNTGVIGTRRRAYVSEFKALPDVGVILDELASKDARLITIHQTETTDEAYVEIAHEVLIKHWQRLRDWLEENQDMIRTQNQILPEAMAWEATNTDEPERRDPAWLLLRGPRLVVAEEWLKKNAALVAPLVKTYIQANIEERSRQEALERQKAEELRQQQLETNYNLAKVFEEKSLSAIKNGDKYKKDHDFGNSTYEYRKAWLYLLEAQQYPLPEGKAAVSPFSFGSLFSTNVDTLLLERQRISVFSRIYSLAYSPDGKVIVSGSRDGKVRWWDTLSGENFKTLQSHAKSIYALAYSPDGKVIASGGAWDTTVRLWDANSGQSLKQLQGHTDSVYAIVYSPDGKFIASASRDRTVRLWDALTGVAIKTLQGHVGYVDGVTYSPDSKVIASGSRDGTVRLWDAYSGELLNVLQCPKVPVWSIAYSPDGKIIANGLQNGMLWLWDVSNGTVIKTLQGHMGSVDTVTYSPDGKVICSGASDNTVRLWDAHSGEPLRTLRGHIAPVWSVVFSPDGKVIASGSIDHSLRLWDTYSGNPLDVL